MASFEVLSSYVKKLSHPMKEIRERSLQLLLAKMRLGWELHDELAGTRDLLEALLAWFQVHQPTLQREALELFLKTIKTKSGSYIAKELGIRTIIDILNKIKNRLHLDALEMFEEVMETLRFLNTVESEENVNVPRLALSEISSDMDSNSGYYNLGSNRDSSKETSISNGETDLTISKCSNNMKGISVLLFPWVELSSSDLKTLTLVEDSLKLLKSTRRCCRFIRDVFLRDFPVEIFLNRPTIIKTLLTIADRQQGGHPSEAFQVLLSITCLLRRRLIQLFSLDLITNTNKIPDEQEGSDNGIDAELEQLRSINIGSTHSQREDGLAILRQLSAPIFALETTHAVLSTMARSVVLVEPGDRKEVLNMKELNLCLSLVESLIKLLIDCVRESFWSADHSTKTQRDIAHKSCMVMRTLGDLLEKYRKSFNKDIERLHHRVAWLRLVSCAEMLLHWAKRSALPPSALVSALQVAQLDPAIDLLYPKLSKRISTALLTAKSSVDQEYKSKYRELTKLFASMEHAVQFMKRKESACLRKNILNSIKDSLPVLQLHQSEAYLKEISDILLHKSKLFDFDEKDWSTSRSIALTLMAHSSERVRVMFYTLMLDMVKSVLIGDDDQQNELEKCLMLICDVGIMTEICCHGLSSTNKEVESSASQIMLYLLRGRMVLSESCWWRLLASLMPVFPLLHVYAAHDTELGRAICKSLEPDIVECMGVSTSEMVSGLVRLLFVNCPAVQLDAANLFCRLIDDEKYLPPCESIRTSILMNALRRLQSQDFNVDANSSPTRTTQSTGLTQILEVLKQDVTFEETSEFNYDRRLIQPALEPSLRRSTLQQLAVMMRQQELHTAFLQNDGLNLVVALLRMSLTVDDYLAFPECAISCVSILNSICFMSRHSLAKISDLPLLLIRVILVFPSNENCVLMAAQVLALVAWAGFVLQELDSTRHRIPALPLNVTQRTSLPFKTNSYWNTSPNAEHSFVEWLLSEELWRSAVRVRWWWVYAGGAKALRANTFTPLSSMPSICSPTEHDILTLRATCVATSCAKALLALENATSHSQVTEALCLLESYTTLVPLTSISNREFGSLPWQHSRRFLCSPPASTRDIALLVTMLQFVIAFMDNVPNDDGTMTWIKSLFIGKDAVVIALLSRERLFPQQTAQEDIELTQLRIHIVKILLRCVILLEKEDDYDSSRMESLLKILLACLENVDLKNFHVLGYLNELIRCVRYVHYSRYCKLSEDTLLHSLRVTSGALSGCAGGAGRKGQACRLDAMLALLAMLAQLQEEAIPVQRWSEAWNAEVVYAVSNCITAERAELRAAALHVVAALAHYAQMLPQLVQSIPRESLSRYALDIFCQRHEANAVRAAAATLLTTVTSRISPYSQVFEKEVLQELKDTNFVEHCLHIFVEFCNKKDTINYLEPNVPLSLLERVSELEVRAQKSEGVSLCPSAAPFDTPPPAPALLAAAANALHNVTAFKSCPVQHWNEQGLYRVLFRCASWPTGAYFEMNTVRTAACRALAASCVHKCVRSTLAATKDCLYNLLMTLTPMEEDERASDSISARSQALLLLAALLPEREAGNCVWYELTKSKGNAVPFFHLLLQCLETEESDLLEAALYCLTRLCQSTTHRKHADKSKDAACIEFLDNLKSPLNSEHNDRFCAGDSGRDDCQPEYMIEDVCRVLMRLYHRLSENKKHLSSQDESWTLICSCLSSVLSVSWRARQYAVHRHCPAALLATMQAVRDRLSLQGKPADVIRNANHDPALQTLYWILTVMTCSMLESIAAKESFADGNMAVSLVKLWPWCMMTEQLRYAVMSLLLAFTNDCAKAWASMCSCVGGHNVLSEVCTLLSREATRPRPSPLLRQSLRVLTHCSPHHHCRSIILKSEALQCACRVRGDTASENCSAQLCAALAKYSDGASALLAVKPRPTQPRMLPALANAAHHTRLAFLQSPELLEVLSGTLLTGDTAAAVHAARAVWALAANNHRAKLVMRSAGMTTAVQASMQRLSRHADRATQRALELLTYTYTVLQAT